MGDNLFEDIERYLREGPKDRQTLVSEEELEFIIEHYIEGCGEEGATEEEVIAFIRYIENARLTANLVSLFMKGFVYIKDSSGEFKNDDLIVVRLTELGKQMKAELT